MQTSLYQVKFKFKNNKRLTVYEFEEKQEFNVIFVCITFIQI